MFDPFATIQITTEYSNAVLVAILPYITDFAQRLDVPMELPVTVQQVQLFRPSTEPGDVGGCLTLTNGYWFKFDDGHVRTFRLPLDATNVLSASQFRATEGRAAMGKEETIQFARNVIRRLGYHLEDLYMDFEPGEVIGPIWSGKPYAPRFIVSWDKPHHPWPP